MRKPYLIILQSVKLYLREILFPVSISIFRFRFFTTGGERQSAQALCQSMDRTIQELRASFEAFNQNGLNSLIYIMQQNLWFVVIAVCAILSMVMMLKREVDYSVNEEQTIL